MENLLPKPDQLRNFAALGCCSAAAATALLLLLRRSKPEPLPLPPGPQGIPILGVLTQLDRHHSHEQFQEMHKQHGPIISYRMGTQLFISICDYELIKEMTEAPVFAGRPQSATFQRSTQGCGLLFSEGAGWSEMRRLALRTLRDFGFASDRSAGLVAEQVDLLVDFLEVQGGEGRPVRFLDALTEATNSVIGQLTLNLSLRKGEEECETMKKLMHELFASNNPLNGLIFLFPSMAFLLDWLPLPDQTDKVNSAIQNFVGRFIDARKKQMQDQRSQEADCLCDSLLEERRKAEAIGDFETFKDKQIIRTIMELFFAGTDTTARSIEWLLIYCAFHPDIQRRVQEELDSVVGSGRRPKMADRQQLAFTCATIEESLRLVSLAPLGLFHRAMTDTSFHGFRIPSDAFIVPFVYGVNRDSRVWEQPQEFRPERFLRADGSFSGSGKSIPFSIGRRVCLGESLARMELFLIFSSLLQRYNVSVTKESVSRQKEILRGSLGILRIPLDCPLIFTAR